MTKLASVFEPIKSGDYQTNVAVAHGDIEFNNANYSGSGIAALTGLYRKIITPLGDTKADNDPVNFDNSNQFLSWYAVNQQYYKFPYDPAKTFEHAGRETEKFIYYSASIFSIPYAYTGEKIKPSSVTITTPTFSLSDDKFGNLKDGAIISSSFAPTNNLIAYWGFNDQYKYIVGNFGTYTGFTNWTSKKYAPDQTSQAINVNFQPGVELVFSSSNGNIITTAAPTTASFAGTGFVTTNGSTNGFWNSNFGLYYSGVSGSGETELSPSYTGNGDNNLYDTLRLGFNNGITLTPSGSIQTYNLYVYNQADTNYYVRTGLSLSQLTNGLTITLTGDTNTNFANDLQTAGFTSTSNPTGNTNTITWNSQSISPTTSSYITSGIAATFETPGVIETVYDEEKFIYSKADDFAISLWVKAPVSQSNINKTTNSILNNRGTTYERDLLVKQGIISASHKPIPANAYAWDVNIYNQTAGADSGKILVRRSDGTYSTSLTSTTTVTSDVHTHILYQKTGSALQLYVNGTLESNTTDNLRDNPINRSNLYIGALNRTLVESFSGSIDEVRIYNTGLSQNEITSLANRDFITGSLYQTNVAGNVFYRHGSVVISNPMPKYHNMLNGAWTASMQSTHRVYENEVFVRIPKDKFNYTFNPTALKGPDTDEVVDELLSGSLTPYITTIGLYNERGEMLAVAKLSAPLQKRTDVDTNIIIRWDT
jgi:hypothetical protein